MLARARSHFLIRLANIKRALVVFRIALEVPAQRLLRLQGGLQLLNFFSKLRNLAGSRRRRLGRALLKKFDAFVHPDRLEPVRLCFFIQLPNAIFKNSLLLNDISLLQHGEGR
jgi:hypothetical protein